MRQPTKKIASGTSHGFPEPIRRDLSKMSSFGRLRFGDTATRRRAIQELLKLTDKKRVVDALGKRLSQEEDANIRELICEAFAGIGVPESIPALVFALSDSSERVQLKAVQSLGAIGGRTAMQLLSEKREKTNPSTPIHFEIDSAIRRIQSRLPKP